MRTLILLLLVVCLGTACRKTNGGEDAAAKQRSTDFQASVQDHKYKLVSFYSDKPIDYITNDAEVHVPDDENYFGANGALTIYQNADKFPGNNSEQINGSYSISVRGSDVIFKFVDYIYVPTEYKLLEFDNANFIVYIDGPSGSKLYSKFSRIQ
jgi:hypothetical protein